MRVLRVCDFVTDSAQAAICAGEIKAGEKEVHCTDFLILHVNMRCSKLRSPGKTHFQMCVWPSVVRVPSY